jgi:hypothetical protein
MPNEGQLKILKQRVEVWNKWRKKENPEIMPDLSSANLRMANFHKGNFDNLPTCH